MHIPDFVACPKLPCSDVLHEGYHIPHVTLNPQQICWVMISEATPPLAMDYYYTGGEAAYEKTTLGAFRDAGVEIDSFSQLLEKGIYLTSAVKCAKVSYGIKAGTIKQCSLILEEELNLFPNLRVIMLMGDVAIKALNYIALRGGEGRAVPAGSTNKIRGGEYFLRDIRVFPSYLQVGPSYGIEKSKQRMIVEDIQRAFRYLGFTSRFDNSYSRSGRVE